MPPSNPNNTNNPAFFGIKVSKPGVPVQKATPKQLLYSNNFATTTWYDNQDARIVEGLLPDGTYGMWVSKPGFDVSNPASATNNALIFNSNQDVFKIVRSGSINITIPATFDTFTPVITPHNLAYAPYIQAFINIAPVTGSTQWSPLPYTENSFAPSGLNVTAVTLVRVSVDATNIYLNAFSTTSSTGATYTVQYFLLSDFLSVVLPT